MSFIGKISASEIALHQSVIRELDSVTADQYASYLDSASANLCSLVWKGNY